tara:strand:- start:487 stop:1575 length:1089 start_codon:yes stop_codon:yes gene_type:complete
MIPDPVWRSFRGLKLIIRGVLDYHLTTTELLWSRGWHKFATRSGNGSFLYPLYPTRYRTVSLRRLQGAQGIIWLRLGVDPEKPEIATGSPGDVNSFARDVIGSLGGPVVLVTSDGDLGVPSGLQEETVTKILNDPFIVAWFTQNLEDVKFHEKLKAIPIGLDLHTPVKKGRGPRTKIRMFREFREKSVRAEDRIFRIWSDVHLEQDLGDMMQLFPKDLGKPGAALFSARVELRNAIERGELTHTVDTPSDRLPLEKIWERYGQYFFVISLPGHGLDCHRTWEALAMGATVITIHSPLDALLEKYRVVFLDRQSDDSEWWTPMGSDEWLTLAAQSVRSHTQLDLDWNAWIQPMKALLNSSRNN